MWRNSVVRDFVGWLERWNRGRAYHEQAGFYGLDLYSLHTSIAAVLEYLDAVDPPAARRARARYACFESYGGEPEAYGRAAAFALDASCEQEVVDQLVELRRGAAKHADRGGQIALDEQFYAEQNAHLVKNAEEYYRAMFRGRASSWNMRDEHMAETLEALRRHVEKSVGDARVVVWEHNSHLGDARATEMGASGELNLGQLVRERYGDQVVSVGFTTYEGTVTAASDWGGRAERKRVRPGLPSSWEALFHDVGVADFWLDLDRAKVDVPDFERARLERAIGVIYLPRTERRSHYFLAVMPHQFDAVIHVDRTRALEPLERTSAWDAGELPEAYPTGL
jgi:erythromycin esterase-like protein